jgi:hypothetical protein
MHRLVAPAPAPFKPPLPYADDKPVVSQPSAPEVMGLGSAWDKEAFRPPQHVRSTSHEELLRDLCEEVRLRALCGALPDASHPLPTSTSSRS